MEAIRNGCVIYVLSLEWMKIVAFLFHLWVLYQFHLVKNKTLTFYVHLFHGYGSSANTFSTTWSFFVRFLLSVIMESKNYSKNIFE